MLSDRYLLLPGQFLIVEVPHASGIDRALEFNGTRKKINFERPGQQQPSLNSNRQDTKNY
jgi:hypothetical protein